MQLGKYGSDRDNILDYLVSSGWGNESSGDVESPTGHFARISNSWEEVKPESTDFTSVIEDQLEAYNIEDTEEFRKSLVGHFLVVTNSQGFVSVVQYETEEQLLAAYKELEIAFYNWDNQDAEEEEQEDESTEWPKGRNPVLSVLRETFDTGDAWGSNITFLFALCDIASNYGVPIPTNLAFSQSPFGADTEDDTYKSIEGLLSEDMYIHRPLTFEEFKKHVSHALKVCARYDSLLRLAGKDY